MFFVSHHMFGLGCNHSVQQLIVWYAPYSAYFRNIVIVPFWKGYVRCQTKVHNCKYSYLLWYFILSKILLLIEFCFIIFLIFLIFFPCPKYTSLGVWLSNDSWTQSYQLILGHYKVYNLKNKQIWSTEITHAKVKCSSCLT